MFKIVATWLADTVAVIENTPRDLNAVTRLDILEGRLLLLGDAVAAHEKQKQQKKAKKDKQRRLMEHA